MHTDDDIFESLDIDGEPGRKPAEDDIFERLEMEEKKFNSGSPAAGGVSGKPSYGGASGKPASGGSPGKPAGGASGSAGGRPPYGGKPGKPVSGTGRTAPRELNTVASSLDERKLEREKEKKRKSTIRKVILWTIVEIFTLGAIFAYGYILRNWNLIARPEVKLEAIENHNISLDKKKEMEGYWNVAVFGVDSRGDQVVGRGLNSDVILIASINRDNGEIRLVSVFRDTYLNISENNSFNKINQAYAIGGPEQALAALNKNLDLNIQNYVTFNWKAVADGINILGGVDNIPISKAELYYINAYITETVNATGVGSHQLTHTGEQHLDGIQAVAYGRLRNMDNDFARTERQRNIIRACFEKARGAGFSVLNNIMVVCFPQVATNIGFNNIIAMAQSITDYTIVDTVGFPWARGDAIIGKRGDVVVPTTLESNVRKLHEFLFNDTNYTPSDAVLRYSQKIKEDSKLYKEGKFIDSVSTDGGVIQKPKVSQTAAVSYEDEDESDEEVTLGVDENGNYIYPTDEDGNIVIPTDADGKVIYPTDEDGNIIRETTGERPTELADGTDSAAAPGELDESDEEPGEYGPGGVMQPTTGSNTNPTRVGNDDNLGDTPGGGGPGGNADGPGTSARPTASSPEDGEDDNADDDDAPGNTVTPGGTAAPGDTTVPGGTTTPGSTTTPGGSAVPGGSTTLGGSTTPGDSTTRGDSTTPGGSSSGSTTTPGGAVTPGGADAPGSGSSGTGDVPGGSAGTNFTNTEGPSGNTSGTGSNSGTGDAPGSAGSTSSDSTPGGSGPDGSSQSTNTGGPGSGAAGTSDSMPGVVTNVEPGGGSPDAGANGPG